MKYIRTKDGIHKCREGFEDWEKGHDEIKSANAIEELCDGLILLMGKPYFCEYDNKNKKLYYYGNYSGNYARFELDTLEKLEVYSYIKTDKGLIYVAKMKGVLPNGEIDWELLKSN